MGNRLSLRWGGVLLLNLVGTLVGEVKPAAWEYTGAAGVSASSGNSDSLAYHLRFLGTYRDEDEDAQYGLDYFYSEYAGVKTNDSLRLYGNYNHLIGERFYYGLGGSLYTNEASLLDYRADLGPVFGYYFLRDEKKLLSAEVGVGYAFESKAGASDTFATFRLAQHFDYRWTEITRVRQSVSLTPKIENPGSYVFEFAAGLDLRINDNWDIQPRVVHRVDLSPAFGQEKADTLVTLGFAYSLNGFLKEKVKRADERKTLKKKDLKKEGNRQGWIRNVGAGIRSTKGNSDTFDTTINYETAFRSKEREFFFKGDYRYGQSKGVTTAHRLGFGSSYNWKFSPENYAGTNVSFLHDDASDLSYRITPGVHAGRYFILTDNGGFALEAGVGQMLQKQAGVSSAEPAFSVAQRLYWQLGDHTYVTQEVAYQGLLEDPADFNISSYLYLDTFLSENLSWRVGAEYYYDSTPSGTKEKGDFSLTTGIGVRF
ncbi:MAG: DUF481 domain-containing protein [Verrucomicrobiaceae bacterium]